MTNVVDANVDVGKSADHANGIDTPDHEELSAYVSRRIEGAVFDEARRLLSRKAHQVEGDPDDLEEWMSGGGGQSSRTWGTMSLGRKNARIVQVAGVVLRRASLCSMMTSAGFSVWNSERIPRRGVYSPPMCEKSRWEEETGPAGRFAVSRSHTSSKPQARRKGSRAVGARMSQ